MKQKYDFGEKKSLKENRIVSEDFSNVERPYDFVTEGNAWFDAAKAVNSVARHGYTRNMLRGAGAGAAVGAVGNVVNNAVKRDDDPTKKGMFRAALSGARKGAAVGGVAGGVARFATGRTMFKDSIGKLNVKAAEQAAADLKGSEAARKYAETLRNLGNEATANGNKVQSVLKTGEHHLHGNYSLGHTAEF